MTLGELKISSLMLVAPSLEISFDKDDGEAIEEKIMELKSNPSIVDYLNGIVFSINRAFSIIETRGLTRQKRARVGFDELVKATRGYELEISKIGTDVLYVEAIYQKDVCHFEKEADTLILPSIKKEPLEIVYRQELKRISEATSDLYVLEFGDCLAEIIPYFVKSELILSEDAEESRNARKNFFDLLNALSVPERVNSEAYVDTVYRIW